jgi:hypothetical protein
MALFTRRSKILRLAAVNDVAGLRDALLDAARDGAAGAEALDAAAGALVDLGEDGVLALLDAILSHPDEVQFGWIDQVTFHRAAGPEAVARLSGVMRGDADAHVRLVACTVLRRLDTTLADEAFALALEDSDPHVRLSAARGLADHDDARGVRALVDWAAHADDPVPALIGFVRLADPRLVPVLERLRDSRRDPRLHWEFDRTIADIRAAQGRRPRAGAVSRLEGVRDRLRSIEVVDRLERPGSWPPILGACQQIPVLCDNIDHAVATLRAGRAADGRAITPAQIGNGLTTLVADVRGPELTTQMGSVLEPRGVRALLEEIAELERIATELQEHSVPIDRGDG